MVFAIFIEGIVQHDVQLIVVVSALIQHTSSNLVVVAVSGNTGAADFGNRSINGERDLLETLQGSLHRNTGVRGNGRNLYAALCHCVYVGHSSLDSHVTSEEQHACQSELGNVQFGKKSLLHKTEF